MDSPNGKISNSIPSIAKQCSHLPLSNSTVIPAGKCPNLLCAYPVAYTTSRYSHGVAEKSSNQAKHPEVYQHTEGFTKDEAWARHMQSQELRCDQCGCGLRSLRFGILTVYCIYCIFYIQRGLYAVEERVGL